ncbi:methyltransferase domain-containing protein [Micromonospora sp. DT43]|uniref:methyltransferase domain-containing protein n=1 Tax=Micromonospora sp. DT43 TaxID=3393440 RepID=UPI003CE93DE0
MTTTAQSHLHRMAHTYSVGSFARVVAAGGNLGFMNLGFASDPVRPGTTSVRQRRMAQMVLDAVAPASGERLLDVGCGSGGMVGLITRRCPDARPVGLNIDQLQLARARVVAPGRPGFVAANAERLPFLDATFDAILSVELLSHIADKAALVAELARVLRPGGRIVLAYIALARNYADFPDEQRTHLRRVAEFFAEQPRDIPTRTTVEAHFAAVGLRPTAHSDLTDGVFGPRHHEFLRLLRWLGHDNDLVRRAAARWARVRWGVDPHELTRFLAANTAAHPCRFYEYHLLTLTKDEKEPSS